jgi:exo-beta-1,3-glucanase (GH17 family)
MIIIVVLAIILTAILVIALVKRSSVRLIGLNFSPYGKNQGPWTADIPYEQIERMIATVAPYTDYIRIFTHAGAMGRVPEIVDAYNKRYKRNIKVSIGMWLNHDIPENEQLENVHKFISYLNSLPYNNVHMAIVGSETLLRAMSATNSSIDATRLMSYMRMVKERLENKAIVVATAEPVFIYMENPELLKVSDVALLNIYSFWEMARIRKENPNADAQVVIDEFVKACESFKEWVGDKPLVISETGWPSTGTNTITNWIDGEPLHTEVTGDEDTQATYLKGVVDYARSANMILYYFTSFDESWKNTDLEQDGFFGLWSEWDTQASLKPKIKRVLKKY